MLIKNVVCSYTCSRDCAKHDLAQSVKVEVSSSPPWKLKEPGSAPRLFQFKFSFYLSSFSKPTIAPLQSILVGTMSFQAWQNQFRFMQSLQSMLQDRTIFLFQNIFASGLSNIYFAWSHSMYVYASNSSTPYLKGKTPERENNESNIFNQERVFSLLLWHVAKTAFLSLFFNKNEDGHKI